MAVVNPWAVTGELSEEEERQVCVSRYHLPPALPANLWRGALAPQRGDRVLYKGSRPGVVTAVDVQYPDDPSYDLRLDDGHEPNCTTAQLQPRTPWRALHALLSAASVPSGTAEAPAAQPFGA